MPVYERDICEAAPPERREEATGEDQVDDWGVLSIFLMVMDSRSFHQLLKPRLDSLGHDEAPADAEEPEAFVPDAPIEEPEAGDPAAEDEGRAGKQDQEPRQEIDGAIEPLLGT
jgi:hypothetical protein